MHPIFAVKRSLPDRRRVGLQGNLLAVGRFSQVEVGQLALSRCSTELRPPKPEPKPGVPPDAKGL
jgi:hypothetical protein